VGFCGGMCGSAVLAAGFFLFFLFFQHLIWLFLSKSDLDTPSVFSPILTAFCQIFPEISFKSVSVHLFTPSVFLPILTTFCQISPEIFFKSVSARFFTPSVFLPILTTFYQIFPEISFKICLGSFIYPPQYFCQF
jgi:Na+-transporting NADH:ubiquinone oxidoreductase subunit NqrE